jgi:hypothetical protein
MNQDPSPYLAMKQSGTSAEEVYRKARKDGFKRHECLLLLMGIFDMKMHVAREVGHEIWRGKRDKRL